VSNIAELIIYLYKTLHRLCLILILIAAVDVNFAHRYTVDVGFDPARTVTGALRRPNLQDIGIAVRRFSVRTAVGLAPLQGSANF
jgi:hypothetical protein